MIFLCRNLKNKLKIYFFWIIILLFSNSFSSADEFTFNASEIIVLNNENNELLSFKANSFLTTITKLPPKLPKSSGKDKRSDEARKRVYEEWKKRRDESK